MSLEVVHAAGPISIQDLGRTGHMHEGVPPGGAAVRARLIAANREAGNREGAMAIEVFGALVVRAAARVELATPAGARVLEAGEELRVSDPGWTYLAVRGGVAGRAGRVIKKGDRIESAGAPPVRFPRPPELREGPVRVMPGPDLDAFAGDAIATLCAAPYDVAIPARTGAVLKGALIPRVAGYRERSRPMVKGAIEVARDGHPIVLGPDHPTTGGYPLLAVVAADDLDRVFAQRRVQFTT